MLILKPTNDFLFKKIFGQEKNADILKDLLEAILPEKNIQEVMVNKDVSLDRKLLSDKLGILDIVATLDNHTKVNIEMQVTDFHNTLERSLFYLAGLFHESLNSSANYIELPPVISIWITDFDIFEKGPFHEIARINRDYEHILLTDKLELHYIQLPKFKQKCKRISTKLEQWLTFIRYDNLEEIKMIDNNYVKKAEKEYEYLTGDAATRRIAELREKAIRDEQAGLANMRKIGFEEGLAEGKAEGISEGEKNGKLKEKISLAKKMIAQNYDIKTISDLTDLSIDEIQKIIDNSD